MTGSQACTRARGHGARRPGQPPGAWPSGARGRGLASVPVARTGPGCGTGCVPPAAPGAVSNGDGSTRSRSTRSTRCAVEAEVSARSRHGAARQDIRPVDLLCSPHWVSGRGRSRSRVGVMGMPAACATDARSRFDASTAPPDQTARSDAGSWRLWPARGGAYLGFVWTAYRGPTRTSRPESNLSIASTSW